MVDLFQLVVLEKECIHDYVSNACKLIVFNFLCSETVKNKEELCFGLCSDFVPSHILTVSSYSLHFLDFGYLVCVSHESIFFLS